MKRYFYSHLIDIELLSLALDEIGLEDTHKIHLSAILDSSIHQTILDVILSELSIEDKRLFMEKLTVNPQHPEIMEFLDSKIDNIASKIQKAVKDLTEELHKDIKESKRYV